MPPTPPNPTRPLQRRQQTEHAEQATLSTLEAQFLFTLRALAPDLSPPAVQFVFAPPRRFRSDFAWPDRRLLVECEGGVWNQGKHGRGSGVETDCDKSRHVAAHGYRVFRVTRKSLDENPHEIVRLLRLALDPHPRQEAPTP